ncbi:hypothetical protein [Paraferrimonas haliotis]|uniref:hypothetical protein n=1 Tax=Paraferrimonas haliotis TaxID=2013866 RepID=UPI000BA9362D|nr:hypothetical protein [Paraferrimonas haliotis]
MRTNSERFVFTFAPVEVDIEEQQLETFEPVKPEMFDTSDSKPKLVAEQAPKQTAAASKAKVKSAQAKSQAHKSKPHNSQWQDHQFNKVAKPGHKMPMQFNAVVEEEPAPLGRNQCRSAKNKVVQVKYRNKRRTLSLDA